MKRRENCIASLLVLFALTIPAVGEANEVGRYQVVPLGTSDAVVVIDTKEGHLWTWTGNPRVPTEGYVGIIYQGIVVPGKKTGEVIDQPGVK